MVKNIEYMENLLNEELYEKLNKELMEYFHDRRTTVNSFKKTLTNLFRNADAREAFEVACAGRYISAVIICACNEKADKALGFYLLSNPEKRKHFDDFSIKIIELADDVIDWQKGTFSDVKKQQDASAL